MKWKFPSLLLLAGHAFSQPPYEIPPMLRFQCSQLVVDRLDPLVFPGSVPSPHLHQIVGGNSFTPSMPHDSHDLVTESTCTSCTFSEDFSNYWTAVLYFRARNGTFKRVPQFPNEFLTGEGGITIYYIPDVSNKTEVTAFRPGFRMVVGDATATAPTSARKICYRCMPESGDLTHLNCDGPDVETFPTEPCPGGIRSVVTFPTCWDGVNLDSPNHMTHVAFSEGANDTDVGPTGRCPESHPIVIPQVMYEIMWNTTIFNDPELWPEDGSQPFVLSTGDEDGWTQHGDYVFGWKDDSLQRSMDARCFGDICSVLETQTTEDAMKCTIPRTVDEKVDGWLTDLPGRTNIK
ncbi:hypothetical protein DDE83_008593 [Stemphylium lycopersici]|uniref:DUF1996 domain-containing protein n=1 Tax=Stemphylium lycopersici TaxID=183478 RepID=A0A364MTP2_STELY|nr:hypothetical protein DDE83_008593 [Stemphylium lycopersici]